MVEHALALLRQMFGPQATFRPDQWEAIQTLAGRRERLLVVQRTGWGKSVVYFLSAKLLREQGAGPTLLISPLLSLMRNQLLLAQRIGVRAVTLHSGNREEWDTIESSLAADSCDILLISPERLNNERFLNTVLPGIRGRVGLFVVDEAHCISDWGHDFRPDYRRIRRIVQALPKGIPVLATTATANNRVVEDVLKQLGPNLQVLRGPLARSSLRLQNLRLADQSERLAWLAENLPKFKGSGIIYCLTIADTERVAKWLQQQGIAAKAYHAGENSGLDREGLEQELLDNRIKALVATVALGMGFDKPDLSFVIHFQRPGSVVAYYQQVGRAGRALERAYGILLSGHEDDEIQDYFIKSAFPSVGIMEQILQELAQTSGLTIKELLCKINVSWSVAERALKLLEMDGAVGIDRANNKGFYFRTPNPWQPDLERIRQVTALRRAELAQMQAYVEHQGCLMEFLARALDDPEAGRCGICAKCQGKGFQQAVKRELAAKAISFLKADELILEPRKQWPAGLFPDLKAGIPADQQNAPGRILSYYGDAGWGKLVKEGKEVQGRFSEELVQAAIELIRKQWRPDPPPTWLTAIPSPRHPQLVADFATRLAALLGLPFVPALTCKQMRPEQNTMENSSMQAQNVKALLAVGDGVRPGPVLLVDDLVDSRWTMTYAGWLLRTMGSGTVFPFALARSTTRNN